MGAGSGPCARGALRGLRRRALLLGVPPREAAGRQRPALRACSRLPQGRRGAGRVQAGCCCPQVLPGFGPAPEQAGMAAAGSAGGGVDGGLLPGTKELWALRLWARPCLFHLLRLTSSLFIFSFRL